MSTSKASRLTSSYARFLRPVLVAASLVVGVTTVQAADPAPPANSNRNISNNNELQMEEKKNTQNNQNTGNTRMEKAVSDTWITTKVKSEILANSASKGLKVSVTTKSGVVVLTGKLPTQDAADLVKTIAQNVQGVQSVDVTGLSVESAS